MNLIIWLLAMRINLPQQKKLKLRLLIIKQKLDISLAESVVSSPIASEHVIEQLTLFQHERRHLRPKIGCDILALVVDIFNVCIANRYRLSIFRLVSKSVCISMDRIFNSNNIAQSHIYYSIYYLVIMVCYHLEHIRSYGHCRS